jgi:hypothetical protein
MVDAEGGFFLVGGIMIGTNDVDHMTDEALVEGYSCYEFPGGVVLACTESFYADSARYHGRDPAMPLTMHVECEDGRVVAFFEVTNTSQFKISERY